MDLRTPEEHDGQALALGLHTDGEIITSLSRNVALKTSAKEWDEAETTMINV